MITPHPCANAAARLAYSHRLNDLFVKAVRSQDVRDKLAAQGITTESSTPEQFAARIKADTAKFKPLIEASGMKK